MQEPKHGRRVAPEDQRSSPEGRLNACVHPAVKRKALALCRGNLSRYIEDALTEKMARDARWKKKGD